MPTLFYYTGKIKESSSHPQSTFMVLLHLLTIKYKNSQYVHWIFSTFGCIMNLLLNI